MLRIAGVNLDDNRRVDMALTSIFGIGRTTSQQLLKELDIQANVKVKDLTDADEAKLRSRIEKDMLVEGDLRRELMMNVKRLKEIGSYRGSRHAKKLPARGQRTRTNARTKRGKRVTMGSGRKKSSDKT